MIDSTDNPGLYCAKFPEKHKLMKAVFVVVNGMHIP